MRQNAFSALAGFLALISIAVGCGSDESAPLSRAAFVRQASEICKGGEEEREAALREASKENAQESEESPGDTELEKFVTEVALPPIQAMTKELDELSGPLRDEKKIDVIVSGLEKGIEKLKADPRDAMTAAPFAQADRQAEVYGLTYCKI